MSAHRDDGRTSEDGIASNECRARAKERDNDDKNQ